MLPSLLSRSGDVNEQEHSKGECSIFCHAKYLNAVTFIIVRAHINDYLIYAHVIMSKTSRQSVGVTLYYKHYFRFLVG